MSDDRELSAEEKRAQNIFLQLLAYKPLSIRLGQELERERQKNIDLQAELRRVRQDADKRVIDFQRSCDERLEAADKRIALLEEDLQETTRELTEITTRVGIIREAAVEAEAAAAASRHLPKTPQPSMERIGQQMERELGGMFGAKSRGEVFVPPVVPMRPRENRLATMIDELPDNPIPRSLMSGPMPPEEREQPEKTVDPLAALASILKSPPTSPEHEEQRDETERQR